MVFHNKLNPDSSTNTIKIANTKIEQKPYLKFLGLILDQNLQWTEHLKTVKAKMSSALYVLNTVKNILGKEHLKTLYYSMMQPYIDYGIILWGTSMRKNLQPLNIIQKKAIRTLSGREYNAHTPPLFEMLNILTIEKVYNLNTLKFMFNYHHNTLPEGLKNIFTNNTSIHSHNTRRSNNPHIQSRRTALAGKSLLHTAPRMWNQLQNDITNIQTLKSFCNRVKKLLNRDT